MSLQYYIQEPVNGNFHEISLNNFQLTLPFGEEIDTYYIIMIKNNGDKCYTTNNFIIASYDSWALKIQLAISDSMQSYSNLTFGNYNAFTLKYIKPFDIFFLYIKITKKIPISSKHVTTLSLLHTYTEFGLDKNGLDIVIAPDSTYKDIRITYHHADYNYQNIYSGTPYSLCGYGKLGPYNDVPNVFNAFAANIYLNNELTNEYRVIYSGRTYSPKYNYTTYYSMNFGISPNNKLFIRSLNHLYVFNYTLQTDDVYVIGATFSYSYDTEQMDNFSIIINNKTISDYETIDISDPDSDNYPGFAYDHEVHIKSIVVYRRQLSVPELKKLMEDIK